MNSITKDRSKLGFIGIGAMGSRIAGRLLAHGFQVTVFDRDAAKANALVDSGAIVAPSIAELAQMLFSPCSRMAKRFIPYTADHKACWNIFALVR